MEAVDIDQVLSLYKALWKALHLSEAGTLTGLTLQVKNLRF